MEQAASRPQIVRTALFVGAVGFAIGYIGPVLLSDSNLGPLLGIFITGPAGLVVGALIGILRSALGAGERMLTSELRWLGLAWLGSLLLTLFTSLFGWGFVGLAMQCAVVAALLLLLVTTPRRRLPVAALLGAPLLVAGAALIILASIFPPLLDPKPGEPRFAFLFDPRFDARYNVPQFTADWTMLIIEWSAIASATAALLLLHIAMSPRRD